MLDSIKQKLEQINLIDSTEFKKAGVLIILMKQEGLDDLQILFTKRSADYTVFTGKLGQLLLIRPL